MTFDQPPPPPPDRWGGRVWSWVRFLSRFARLAGPFWASEMRWRANLLTLTLVVLTVGQVAVAVVLNAWLERLFTALEQRALGQFFLLITVFVAIAAANAAIVTSHLWVKRRLQVRWREWLTRRLLREWMAAGRHYQISLFPGEHDNPDGRIAEDIRIGTEYAIDLAHSLLYCALLLISFTQILWTLSGPPELTVGDVTLYIPGHLVWIALLYATVGSWLAMVLGYPLIRTANVRQTAEQDFRFGLAHARESSLVIAMLHGEADERRRFLALFRRAMRAWNQQTAALSHIFLFSSTWSVLSQIFPIFIAAPRYITGAITLGVLMQTAQAFQQMAAALAWPIDNLAKAAEWRASVERVQGLHRAIDDLATRTPLNGQAALEVVTGARPALVFVGCAIDEADGSPAIATFDAEITAGERVLLTGDPATTVKLFKAVAGIWPWGHGRIELPSNDAVFFMPQRLYIPTGPLRDAITYPAPPDAYDDAVIRQALARVELDHLSRRLDEHADWEQHLPAHQQQRFGFARLLLHRPAWIFFQDVAEGLDAATRARLLQIVLDDLPGVTIVAIDRPTSFPGLFTRQFSLVQTDAVARLVERLPGD